VRAAILGLLNEEPMHGYQVIQELEARSGGAWRPSAGSVYPTLQLLEDEGLISGAEVEGKRVFTLTDAGRQAVAEQPEGEPPWAAMAGEAGDLFHQMRDAFFSLGAAGMQVARAGNREQAQKTLDVLVEARKRIYAILAEDE
jgi:DNA-binding PadR family transcriptional regulator